MGVGEDRNTDNSKPPLQIPNEGILDDSNQLLSVLLFYE